MMLKSEFLAEHEPRATNAAERHIGFAEPCSKEGGPLSEDHREYLGDILTAREAPASADTRRARSREVEVGRWI